MEKEMNSANHFFKKAQKAKDIARKTDNNIEQFKIASEYYKQSISYIDKILENVDSTKINFISQIRTLREYYLFESNECSYAYEYKQDNFDIAISFAKLAKSNIEMAIKVIDDNLQFVSEEIKLKLNEHRENWILSLLTINIKLIEPIAKKAMKSKDYITALDSYRKMSELQDNVDKYITHSNLEPVHKRIEKGNYHASKASTAISLAGLYIEKSRRNNYTKEILAEFLDALYFIKLALKANPENEKYKEGVDTTTNNIKSILNSNKDKWLLYLIEFKDNENLKRIMQQTDNDFYKRQKAKVELENDNLKRIIISGGFWFGSFIALAYCFFQFAESSISWYKFIAIIIFTPITFTIIGAFTLKTTNALKEENFLRLIELALRMNFKGLKALTEKNKVQ